MSQQQPKRTMYQEKMSKQPKRTMYPEMMRQHPNRTGTSSQSKLLRAEGSVHRSSDTGPTRAHCSRSVLSNAVSALLAGHAPAAPVHPQPAGGVNPLVQQPTMVNRTVPAGGGSYQNPGADMNQRRMVMEMRQQLQKVGPPYTGFKPLSPPPGFRPLAPPPGFPPRPQTSLGVNTRLELQPPTSSLSMPVGSYHHNQLRYSHADQAARGITGGAVNPTVHEQQQQQQVDKGKRPLLGDQVNTHYNPYEQAAKKRAIENTSKPKYNPITQRMMDMKADAQRNEIKLLQKMPSVSAKGIGPDSRKVQGFLYSYGLQENNGDDVKIMCNCHAALLSPADFVKHAGGGDVAEPLKHITVNVLVSAPPVSLTS